MLKENDTIKEDSKKMERLFDKHFKPLLEDNRRAIDYSKDILKRLDEQDNDLGAISVMCTGAPGSGKTGVLLAGAEKALLKHPNTKVFWNEPYWCPLQAAKIGMDKINIMCESKEIKFFRRFKDKPAEEIHPPVTYFTDYQDCYNKALLGKINVIFLLDRTRIADFLAFLRTLGFWVSIFIDEISECASYGCAGEDWKRVKKLSDILKDLRKTNVNVWADTQALSDCDARILSKMMCFVFLVGSIAQKKRSRITQKAIDNLKKNPVLGNEGWVTLYSRFCKVRFDKIYTPIENPFDARLNGGKQE